MADALEGPQNFISGSGVGGFGSESKASRYCNPYYNVAQVYQPMNIDHMLWWANHFLLRFGFYRSALSRIADYFITQLTIECEDSKSKDRYKESFEKLKWKQTLSSCGLNLLAYGQVYASVNRGFERFLSCPKCKKVTNLGKLNDFDFDGKTGKYGYTCPKCAYKGVHEMEDRASRDIEKTSVTIWNPREIKLQYEETTGAVQYYWDIPKDYINKVTKKNNRFFSKHTPKVIYDSIIQGRLLAFNNKNFVHLKVPVPAGIKTDGRAIPFCIYLFDDFFMLKVLQRLNEAIAFEDIAPFRVIAMSSDTSPQANPILMSSGAQWRANVQKMIEDHRRDPGAYSIFPFPISYENLNSKGKELAPTEFIQQAIGNILNSLNIPQELYSMNLQTQAIGPALRLFENSWGFIVDTYNELLNHWADVIGKIQGLPAAKVSLLPVTLSDDMELKSVVGQLVASNSIARSELLNIYNLDYREQIRKKLEEDKIQKEEQDKQQAQQALQQMADQGTLSQDSGVAVTPGDVMEKAQDIAQSLFPLDGAQRRQKLQEIKAQDTTLYSAVKNALDEMTSQSKSQGLQSSKQQSQQQ